MPAANEDKTKFRPVLDATLESEVEAALGGLSIDQLYETSAAEKAAASPPRSNNPGGKGPRTGTIVAIDAAKDEVLVDFGGKTQGLARFSQFTTEPKVGDTGEFHVERYDPAEGVLILNRKGSASQNVSWETLEVGQVVEGVVTAVNKGGLELTIKNMRAFMPAGQVDLYFQEDLNTFIGQKLTCEVMQFEKESKKLVVSRRQILEREKEEKKEQLLGEIAEGQLRQGTVRSVMDFGAFVDLGGIDGLVHISEMTYRRGRKPSEFVKVGDLVEVKILKIDAATGKLSLSLKQSMPDPWINVESKYAIGTPVTGRVSRVESFGAFVEVDEGIEGLLPVSELSWQRVKSPSEVVKEGDTLRLVVIGLDPGAKRMSFSLKQAGPDPWRTAADNYPRDSTVNGRVTRLVDFGAFIELEAGLEGLVHISELSNQRVRAAGDVAKVGDEVKVRVLEIDPEARRISLSMKRAAETSAATTEAAPVSNKKKPARPLRGGLDL